MFHLDPKYQMSTHFFAGPFGSRLIILISETLTTGFGEVADLAC